MKKEKVNPFEENLSITISEDLTISKDFVAVYILGIEKNNKFFPIYIGETEDYFRRLKEYLGRAKNGSNWSRLYTDSKVGHAIQHILNKYPKYKIQFKIEFCNENNKKKRKEKEKTLINFYENENGYELLNKVGGLKSKDNDDVSEKNKVVTDFIDSLIKKL